MNHWFPAADFPGPDEGVWLRGYGVVVRHGGAYDAGVVEHGRGDDRRPQRQLGQELVGLLANAAADDDEVGGEQRFHLVQVGVEPVGPLAPAELLFLAGVL